MVGHAATSELLSSTFPPETFGLFFFSTFGSQKTVAILLLTSDSRFRPNDDDLLCFSAFRAAEELLGFPSDAYNDLLFVYYIVYRTPL